MKKPVKLLMFGLMTVVLVCMSCAKDGEIGPQGPLGEQGIQGPEGPIGEDGNANVQSYDLTIAKTDWNANAHYGGGNNYRGFDISPDSVGGISVRAFYTAGNLILGYVKISYDSGTGNGTELNMKQLPFLTSVNKVPDPIGIRMELATNRGQLLLTRTTNGFDAIGLADADVPDTTEFRIVLIEASNSTSGKSGKENILNDLKAKGIDLSDYHAVMDYFGLEY